MRQLLSPADDAASRALVTVQTATTRVKETICEGVSKGWKETEITAKLNAVIAAECRKISDVALREQTRKALVTAARKWHYELTETYRILDRNLAREANRQPLDIDVNDLLKKTPYERTAALRKILDEGTSPGIPLIKDYQRSVKIAVKAMSAEPPKTVTVKGGRSYIMPVRLRAELAARYAAAVDNLQTLINDGVLFCWISSHPNCSPRCKDFQGKLYSLFTGKVVIDGEEYGEAGSIDGIRYEPINVALAGSNGDGNGCISGYNCRHRAIEYQRGSKPPQDFSEAEIKREYAIDKQQRSYENRIRQLKTEERQLRACGMTKEAAAVRKQWRRLTVDYQIYSVEHDRAFYPYRYVIDEAETEERYRLNDYLKRAQFNGNKKQQQALTKLKNEFIMIAEAERQVPGFKLAKTVQEAEQYISRYAQNVTYAGITNVKSLNQVNRTVSYLSEKYGIQKLVTISPKMQHKNALAEANGELLHIQKKFANNPTNDEVKMSTSDWEKNCNDAISTLLSNISLCQNEIEIANDSYKRVHWIKQLKIQQNELSKWQENKKYSRHNVMYEGREVESAITHEFGHIIAEQYFQQLSRPYAPGGSAELIRNVYNMAVKNGDIYKISAYARENEREFFAECFTIFELGEEKLPDYIHKMFTEVLK